MTIVGIVGDVRQWGPATAPWPEIYMNYEQHPRPSTDLSVLVQNFHCLRRAGRYRCAAKCGNTPPRFR